MIAPIVIEAFVRYATGKYSDTDIAVWMNQQAVIRQLRAGKQPINKETVRDMLQNRVYTGRVPYADTQYSGTLGQGKKSNRNRREWFEGKHEAIITDDLFEQCQQVRVTLARIRKAPSQHRTYSLRDRVYCADCIANKPQGLVDDNYGRMIPFWHSENEVAYYRCNAKDRGYEPCGEGFANAEGLDEQVIAILSSLAIPADFWQRVETAVQGRMENAAALARMDEIRGIIERIDFRRDQGFISREKYQEKRQQLELEMRSLRPVWRLRGGPGGKRTSIR